MPPVERRQVWQEVYFTVRMFIGIAATWVAISREDKYAIVLAACSALYWWYKAGAEGIKP